MIRSRRSSEGEGGVRILAGTEGSSRTIQVLDADPDQRAALDRLGFAPDLVQRYPPGTRHFEPAVANLRRALEEMVRQVITGSAPDWAEALADLLSRAEQAQVPLAVAGSAALAVRGIDVRPGDIDVMTTPEGADALADSYESDLVAPAVTIPGFGRFGRAFISGIRVEWLGNPPGAQDDLWPLDATRWTIASPFEEVRWKGRILRVPPLEVQRRIEVSRQRLDRVAAIDDHCSGARPG